MRGSHLRQTPTTSPADAEWLKRPHFPHQSFYSGDLQCLLTQRPPEAFLMIDPLVYWASISLARIRPFDLPAAASSHTTSIAVAREQGRSTSCSQEAPLGPLESYARSGVAGLPGCSWTTDGWRQRIRDEEKRWTLSCDQDTWILGDFPTTGLV